MEFTEFSAKTVNDAITNACEHFQVPSTKLEYEVIDNGSSGFLGIGARDAKIKARAKSEDDILVEETKTVEEPKKEIKEEVKETIVPVTDSSEVSSNIEKSPAADSKESHSFDKTKGERRSSHDSFRNRHNRSNHGTSKRSNANFVVIDEKNGVKAFLDSMFAAMKMEVNIELKYAEEEKILDVDFSGPSMGLLIGKRGQTLDAIQYLTSLVVNKGEEDYIHVKVDTENYRKRRKDTLENLARNISFKVKRSKRPVSLEPMNPYERRIIHSALQNDRYVTTYSEGSEPYRRVVVAPK